MRYEVSGPYPPSEYKPSHKIDYAYPEGLDLSPGSPLHAKLLGEVLHCAQASRNHVQKRWDSWDSVEKTLTAYVYADDEEKKVQKKDSRKPVSIVVPVSYAILDTLLTYMTAAFFEHPVFRYAGVGTEDMVGAALLERIVDVHVRRNKVLLNLHTMYRDGFAYGFGMVSPVWKQDFGFKVVKKQSGFFSSMLNRVIGNDVDRTMEEALLFEGNALTNIDPRRCLPDPNVPITDMQNGEFLGWVDRTNMMQLLEEEAIGDGSWFNVKYLDDKRGPLTSQYNGTDIDDNRDKFGMNTVEMSGVSRPVDLIHMYRRIIPKRLGLGESEKPEKWLFTVAADCTIIRAQPLGLAHNRFPAAVIAPDDDGHSTAPVSRMELISGMQGVTDWFFNSHIANVRKSLNDMLVVDPALINMNDVANPGPGKMIRLRRSAWGKGIEGAIKQLNVTDVTKGHVADMSVVADMMQKVSGAIDQVQGVNRGGSERVSATEATGLRSSALSRLEHLARITWVQGMGDIAYMFAMHTQQLMQQSTYVALAGNFESELRAEYGLPIGMNRVPVSPMDLLVDFDIVAHDGTAPGGENIQGWVQVLQTLTTNPQLAAVANLDIGRIFTHVFRQLGAREIDSFKIMSTEQLMQQAQAGNIVPLEGSGPVGTETGNQAYLA